MKKRRHYRRKYKGNSDDNSIRLLILSFIILLAVLFKTITGMSAVTVLKELSTAVTGERSYGEVISTIGKAISDGAKENVIAVFKNDKDAVKEENGEEIVLPVYKEATEDTEEQTKGREIAVPAFNNEIARIEFIDNDEEYVDDTLNVPFEMPTPDNIDDRLYDINFKYERPCAGRVTSPFGYRIHPISNETTFHYGIDLAAAEGSEIRSFADGIIAEKGNSAIFGKYIKVNHKDGFVTFYAHLSEYCCDEGKQIKMGEIIGKAGTTGVATGPHLHFEVRKDGKSIDPSQYI